MVESVSLYGNSMVSAQLESTERSSYSIRFKVKEAHVDLEQLSKLK
jgi:hypothetical protein